MPRPTTTQDAPAVADNAVTPPVTNPTGPDPEDAAAATLDERMAKLEENLDRIAGLLLQQAVAPAAPAAANAGETITFDTQLPEGITRFYSPIRNYAIARRGGWQENVNGVVINHAQEWVRFENGISDCNEEEAAFLYSRPELGHDFWPDPRATPQMGPVVTDGVSTSGSTKRAAPARPAPLVRDLP